MCFILRVVAEEQVTMAVRSAGNFGFHSTHGHQHTAVNVTW